MKKSDLMPTKTAATPLPAQGPAPVLLRAEKITRTDTVKLTLEDSISRLPYISVEVPLDAVYALTNFDRAGTATALGKLVQR